MLKKLRLKFVLVNMSIVLAMLLVIFGLVFHFTQNDLHIREHEMLERLAQAALQAGTPKEQDISLPYIQIRISALGEVVVSGVTSLDIQNRTVLMRLLDAVYASGSDRGMLEEFNLRFCRASGYGYESIALLDVSSHGDILSGLITTGLCVGLVSLLIFLGISLLLARWAVRPVEKAWVQQRQLISDASHELKTPLTVIMSNAELLQSGEYDQAAKDRFGDNILSVSRQMRTLVEGLLELSRVDNGKVRDSFETLDLSALVQDAVLPFEAVFFERGLTLESKITPNIRVVGSGRYLRQVVEILLDNAQKYSEAGTVVLELNPYGRGRCLLSVLNPGTPIPQEELPKLFDRFYRADQSRASNGSYGLGLAVAKSVVQEHRGEIWAQSNAFGNLFCVLLNQV